MIRLCREQIARGSTLINAVSCETLSQPARFGKLVEIHQEGIYPTIAAQDEQEYFANHILRRVEEQLNQLQPERPNIIVVQDITGQCLGSR